ASERCGKQWPEEFIAADGHGAGDRLPARHPARYSLGAAPVLEARHDPDCAGISRDLIAIVSAGPGRAVCVWAEAWAIPDRRNGHAVAAIRDRRFSASPCAAGAHSIVCIYRAADALYAFIHA